ncbi:MAG: hypothetical protein QM770_18560 [Tepidisphaeraceae bacterium]
MCSSSLRYWILISVLAGLLLAARAHADGNPLDPGVAPPAAHGTPDNPLAGNNDEPKDAYTGKFTDGKLTLDLAKQADAYTGTLTLNDKTYPATAQRADDKVNGSFTAPDGTKFDFTLALTVDGLDLTTGATVYHLQVAKKFEQDANKKKKEDDAAGKISLKFGYAPGVYQGTFEMQADTESITSGNLPIEMTQGSTSGWQLQVAPIGSDGKQKVVFTLRQASLSLRDGDAIAMGFVSPARPGVPEQLRARSAAQQSDRSDTEREQAHRGSERDRRGREAALGHERGRGPDRGVAEGRGPRFGGGRPAGAARFDLPRKQGESRGHLVRIRHRKPAASTGTRINGKSTLEKIEGNTANIHFVGEMQPQMGDAAAAYVVKSESHNFVDMPSGMVLGSNGTMNIRVVHGRGSLKTNVTATVTVRPVGGR